MKDPENKLIPEAERQRKVLQEHERDLKKFKGIGKLMADAERQGRSTHLQDIEGQVKKSTRLFVEAERQTLQGQGLERHIEYLKNPGIQQAIDLATRLPLQQYQEMSEQVLRRNERAMAAMLKPY